jgi:hypothetical protein
VHASFINATLRFVGFAPIYRTTVYGLKDASDERRAALLTETQREGTRDASRLRRLDVAASPIKNSSLPL